MNNPVNPEELLRQISQIQHMERGKLCVIRQGPNGPYYNHQRWEGGKNVARYVPQHKLAALQEAIQGYERFQDLVEQYTQLVVARTRAEMASGSKKKALPPQILLAQEQEIDQLITRFQASAPNGVDVQKLEVLVRNVLFKPAAALVGFLLQTAAERIEAAYQPKPGEQRLAPGANNPVCFGAGRAPRMFWPCAVWAPAAGSILSGKTASMRWPLGTTLCPSPPRRNLSCPRLRA